MPAAAPLCSSQHVLAGSDEAVTLHACCLARRLCCFLRGSPPDGPSTCLPCSFGWRTQCNQCGIPKPEDMGPPAGGRGGPRQNVAAKPGEIPSWFYTCRLGSAFLDLVHCLAVLRDRTELSAASLLPQLGGLQCCPTHDARPTLDAGSLFLPQATGSAPPAPTSTSSGASSATTAARASPRTSRRSAPPPPALPPQTLACSRARP